MKVVVLGGTGHVGRAVVDQLREAHEVVSVGLPGSGDATASAVRTVERDLLAAGEPPAELLAGADAVVYALAPRGPRGTGTHRLMVEAAGRLSRAAAAGDVREWVHVSNVSVYPSSDDWVDDATAASPEYPLGHATAAMEDAVLGRFEGGDAAVTFLRTGPVYASDGLLTGISASYVEPGLNWLSAVCRDDVASAVRVALGGGLPQVCVVSGPVPVTAVDAAHAAAARRGTAARPVSDATARRFGADVYGMLTSSVRIRPAALLAAGWTPTTGALSAAPSPAPPAGQR